MCTHVESTRQVVCDVDLFFKEREGTFGVDGDSGVGNGIHDHPETVITIIRRALAVRGVRLELR